MQGSVRAGDGACACIGDVKRIRGWNLRWQISCATDARTLVDLALVRTPSRRGAFLGPRVGSCSLRTWFVGLDFLLDHEIRPQGDVTVLGEHRRNVARLS
jgi:hypothetical protein